MNFSSVGDLAQNLMLRRQGAELKTSLSRLTEELTTGQRQDVSGHLKGDFSALAGLERSSKRLDAFAQVRAGVTIRMDAVQTTLGGMQESIGNFGASLLSAASLEQSPGLNALAATAFSKFEQAVSFLNTQSGGRYLFSGTDSAQPGLVSAEEIMDSMRALASGATDPADLLAQVDTWFLSPGGGFDTDAYQGGADTISGISVSDGLKIDFPVKADDQVFRTMLRDLALTALVAEDAVPFGEMEKRDIIGRSGEGLIAAQDGLTALQRDTGTFQGLLENADVQSRVEKNVLLMAISDLVSADQFETASALEAVQHQIEALYILTARTSQLRLTDYLR